MYRHYPLGFLLCFVLHSNSENMTSTFENTNTKIMEIRKYVLTLSLMIQRSVVRYSTIFNWKRLWSHNNISHVWWLCIYTISYKKSVFIKVIWFYTKRQPNQYIFGKRMLLTYHDNYFVLCYFCCTSQDSPDDM